MIDFRYHLISIIAVFLALAIGIVLGTTALNSALLDDLRANIQGLTEDKEELRSQVVDVTARLDDADAFTEATAGALLAQRLAGRDVVVVAAPGASGDVREAVAAGIEDAGGEVVGPVLLQPDYLQRDPAELDELVAELAPAVGGVADGTPAERLAMLLASAVTTSGDTAGPSDSDGDSAADGGTGTGSAATDTVLDGLRQAGLLRVQGETPEPAPLAVLVAAPGPDATETVDEALERDHQALSALALALDREAVAAVVAGPDEPAGARGLLAALRGDGPVAEQVGTVDDAGSPQGRVATVFALLEAWRGGAGHYGRGDLSTGPLPVPLPGALPPVDAAASDTTEDAGSALGGDVADELSSSSGLDPSALLGLGPARASPLPGP